MTLQELGDKEEALYRKVIDLYRQPQSDQTDMRLQGIFLEYSKVHEAYANLSSADIEALKRGLFIQWYGLAEPPLSVVFFSLLLRTNSTSKS
jgi:hypothetical protein